MQPVPSRRKRWLIRTIKLLVLVLVVWAVRRTLIDAWNQLDEHRWHLEPIWLGASAGLYLAGLLPAALFWAIPRMPPVRASKVITVAGCATSTAFRLAGAHTDSPCLRVKPTPDGAAVCWNQLNVEVYGGILNNSWLDRDLGIAGRLTAADGTHTLVHVGRPLARVPQLAIHLDRGVNDGLTLNPQDHLRPVWRTVASGGAGAPFGEWIAAEAGAPAAPVFWELGLYDVQPAAVLGADASLIASGRLDNQL